MNLPRISRAPVWRAAGRAGERAPGSRTTEQAPAVCEPLAARRRAREGRSRATRQRLREGTRCKTGERQRKRGPVLTPVLFSLVKGDGQPLDPQRDLGTLLCIPLHGLCAARRLARWV